MKSHGMTIDPRHVMLLGDIMTSKVIFRMNSYDGVLLMAIDLFHDL
jgi:hypothetical protein